MQRNRTQDPDIRALKPVSYSPYEARRKKKKIFIDMDQKIYNDKFKGYF